MNCIRIKILCIAIFFTSSLQGLSNTHGSDFSGLVKLAGEKFQVQKRKNDILIQNGLGHLANYVFSFSPQSEQEYVTYFTFTTEGSIKYAHVIELLLNDERELLNQKLIDINSGSGGSCLTDVKMYAILVDAVFLASEFKEEDANPTFSNAGSGISNQENTIPMIFSPPGEEVNSGTPKKLFKINQNQFLPKLEEIINQLTSAIMAENSGNIAIAIAGRFYTRYDETQPFLIEQFITCNLSGDHLGNETVRSAIYADFAQYQTQFKNLVVSGESLYKSTDFGIDALRSILIKEKGGVEGLCGCLTANELAYALKTLEEAEYNSMTMVTRKCILRKLCTEAMTGEAWYWDLISMGDPITIGNTKIDIGPFQNEEGAAIKLMKTLPPDKYVEFLNGLKDELTVGSESKTVFNWLMSRINGSNYDEMIRVLLIMCKTYFNRPDVQFSTDQIINYANEEAFQCNKSGDCIFSSVDLLNNGNVSYSYKVVQKCSGDILPNGFTTGSNVYEETEYSGILDPFAPILLINHSSLPLVGDALAGEGQKEPALVPAFFLQYLADKEFEATVNKYVQAAAIIVDVAALVTGPGLILKAFKASKWLAASYEAGQFLGSGTNLTLNIADVNPDAVPLLNMFNGIVAGWGLTRVTGSVFKWGKVADPVKNGEVITIVTKTDADEFIKKYNELNVPASNLTTTQKSHLAKMDDYLKKEVGNVVNLSWIDELTGVLPGGAKAKITSWIDDGLDASKLKVAFDNNDKVVLYNKLVSSKGLNHQRVIINDYLSVPGVSEGSFISNAVDNISSDVIKALEGKEFTLYTNQAKTFVLNGMPLPNSSIEIIENLSNGILFVKIKPGTKVYRVFDGYKSWDNITMTGNTKPNGAFWTLEKPTMISEVIEGAAVMPEWNGMTKIIEIEVPETGLYGWYGKAAKQPASSNTTSFYLKGGEDQVIISFEQNQQSISSIATSITLAPWVK
jgi:hypothetical protein